MRRIDLSGKWKLKIGDEEKYEKEIQLPNTLSAAKIGPINETKETDFLTDKYKYVGKAYFTKDIDLDSIEDKSVKLFIERTRISTVYFDGEQLDSQDSLVSAHIHKLPDTISSGRHNITVMVSNKGYKTSGGHMTSPDTQTNWLGLLGEICLTINEKQNIKRLWIKTENIKSDFTDITIRVYLAENKKSLIKHLEITDLNNSSTDHEKLSEKFANNDIVNFEKLSEEFICNDINSYWEIKVRIKESVKLWNEYEHNLYGIRVELDNGEWAKDCFGIRIMSHEGLKLLINGNQIFLRGKHDGMIWPLTAYAPMDKESWIERFKIAKEYGINHYRFHTCCPPKAAFEAADQIGIYLEPEIPFWGSIYAENEDAYNKEAQDFLFEEGNKIIESFGNHPSFIMLSMGNELWGNKYYINEMVLDYKSRDDRFMYLGGSNSFQFDNYIMPAEDIYSNVRFSKDRLFRGSYAMCDAPLGFVQAMEPNTVYNYDLAILPESDNTSVKADTKSDTKLDTKLNTNLYGNSDSNIDEYIEIQFGTGVKKVKKSACQSNIIPSIPVVSHEVGQYYFFPDFNEKKKYTGVLEARYLDIYEEKLKENKLFDMWQLFNKASGYFSAACYKLEIEAAMKSENLSGFQLLDLQDFNGQDVALVGILDAFMENKGFITAKQWRGFCSDHVAMAAFPKFIFEEGEECQIPLIISVADYYKTKKVTVEYVILKNDQKIFEGSVFIENLNKRVNEIAVINIADLAKDCKAGDEYKLKLEFYNKTKADDLLGAIKAAVPDSENEYEFYIFPKDNIVINKDEIFDPKTGRKIVVVKTLEEGKKLKKEGKNVICIPDDQVKDCKADFTDAVPGYYCTEFWNYRMFCNISKDRNMPEPVGTLGLAIDNCDMLLNDFPSKFYSTPIWYNFVSNSFAKALENRNDGDNIRIIVEAIDNPERNHKLGILYYDNEILVCNSRIYEISDKPEIKSFARSILNCFFLL